MNHGRVLTMVSRCDVAAVVVAVSALDAVVPAQATELLTGPGAPPACRWSRPSASTGPGVSASYDLLLDHGLTTATNPTQAGHPWPLHLEDPATVASTPTQRIDLVLERGLTPVADTLLGATTADLRPSGLWPSDHAGVLATLRLATPRWKTSPAPAGSGRQ